MKDILGFQPKVWIFKTLNPFISKSVVLNKKINSTTDFEINGFF
jgi:hypothetical protein